MAARPRSASSRRRSSSTTRSARGRWTPRNKRPRRRKAKMSNPVLWDLDARGVATVTLNRPEVNNAYDAGLIHGVLAAMDELGKKPFLRVVVLKGNGSHFQARPDLKRDQHGRANASVRV